MELAKLNEWTETQETQEDSASWCSGRGRDASDWTGQLPGKGLPTSPNPRYRMTTEGCKRCGMWEVLGMEMEEVQCPHRGRVGML